VEVVGELVVEDAGADLNEQMGTRMFTPLRADPQIHGGAANTTEPQPDTTEDTDFHFQPSLIPAQLGELLLLLVVSWVPLALPSVSAYDILRRH